MVKQIILEQMMLDLMFQHHLVISSVSDGSLDLIVKGLMLKEMI
jgi:hypothetical protein